MQYIRHIQHLTNYFFQSYKKVTFHEIVIYRDKNLEISFKYISSHKNEYV